MTPLLVGLLALAALGTVMVIASLRRPQANTFGRLGSGTRRADRGPIEAAASSTTATTTAPTPSSPHVQPRWPARTTAEAPPDPQTVGVARRQFLNRSIVAVFALGVSAFSGAALAFLWPPTGKAFGSKINVGRISDLKRAIAAGGGFHYVPQGRMWITEYPSSALERARSGYAFFEQVEPGLSKGVTALYQVCPHLGCRVPECSSSQWFECPCHGSKYNRVGEKKAGPAPRGMDRFPMEVNTADELIVDTGVIILGPPIGANTTGQEAEGPNCVGSAQPHA